MEVEELEEEEEKVAAEDFSSSYLPYTYIPPLVLVPPNPLSIFCPFTKFLCFHLTQTITMICMSILPSPIFFFLISEPFHRFKEAKNSIESGKRALAVFVKKAGVGFVGALYAYVVVTAVMCLAIALGVGLVHAWVEEPVLVTEKLAFDYADVHPNAVFLLRRGGGGGGGGEIKFVGKNKKMGGRRGVPVGHTFCVSLFLLMPESEYNLQIGIFQLNAELTSSDGYVLAKSTKPCMLRYRSLPIRLMRRILMSVPLLLGITEETQKMTIPMLKHKEGYPRTEAIRISMIPRAGTSFVPQLYEAEIIINSQPPWSKEIVRQWKWTFCVWTSIHIYIVLLIILVRCFKPLIIPPVTRAPRTSPTKVGDERDVMTAEALKEPEVWERRTEEETEVSEALRRWKQSGSEGEAMLLHGVLPDTVGSSASTTSDITREETLAAPTTAEDEGDSESVNFGGSTE